MESPTLRIRLFGALDCRYGDSPLPPLESARAESLLAYLLLHSNAPQPRQLLAFLLWPDSTEQQARTNLRHVLHTLRHRLPFIDQFLDVTSRTLQWRPCTPFFLDVTAFEEAMSHANATAAEDEVATLRTAVALYGGDLLEGCYDEWVLPERERLRTSFIDALARLAELIEARGEYADAITIAERLQRHEPLREETYRLLMRLHDARGERARALHVYHVCVATIEREMGVQPSTATRRVYEALMPEREHTVGLDSPGARIESPPLVGRIAERARLMELWRAAERGRAHLVLVTGEPGIGKTRLIEEFRSWCVHHGAVAAEARSYAAEGALAYGPVVAWLRSEGLKPRLGRLERLHLTELARLLPELLTTMPDVPRPEPLPERDQRRRVFEAVAQAIRIPGPPLLLVADDVQWADRETLQVLHYLLRIEGNARLLVAATARREEVDDHHPLHELIAGLHTLDRCTEIPLDRLTPAESATLAAWVAGGSIAEPDAGRLYDETEGNPLFVVEALRAGWQGLDHGWMSPRVQAAIEVRLAQLAPPARGLVGLAATIGREFTTDVLVDASEVDEGATVQALDELWRRRIIREHGADAYDFSHDKIREVTYRSLSPLQRRRHHLRAARALERRHAHDPGPVSGQLAAHYEQAGAIDQAISWYERAAVTSQQLHANVEAIRLLERALDLIRTLPETRERQERELALLTALPSSLGWVNGWASERLAEAHQRALDLVKGLGGELLPPLLRSMAIASLSRRNFTAARKLGEQLRARGERHADDMLLVEADYVLGIAAFWQGQFTAARRHFEGAVDRYRPDQRGMHLIRYGLDPQVICLSRLGNTLWFLGQPESAIQASERALALADEIGHQFSREVALVFAAMLALELHDTERFRACLARLRAVPAEDTARPTVFSGEAFVGYAEVLDGRTESGIARIRGMLDEVPRVDHAPGMRAVLARLLLGAYVFAGDVRSGLAMADRALGSMAADRLWEAEIRRLRAGFLAALDGNAGEVEAELVRALEVARRQGAKMLELRAATSLLRHRLERTNRSDLTAACDLVAGILESLPEARESREFQEAAALLQRS